MRKTTAVILSVLLLALPLLYSCDKVEQTSSTTALPDTTTAQAAIIAQGETRIEPDLPVKDFGGYTFTFLSHREESVDWVVPDPREIIAEKESGEPINDAVYARNMKIKEKYNVEIALKTVLDEKAAISKTVKAGDDLYDAAILYNNNIPPVITQGLLLQIDKLPYIDLSKPWWDPAAKAMTILNKTYLLAGDLLILDNDATNALLFNKDMMVTYGMDLPYQTVLSGKWTFDKLSEYVRQVTQDLNNDGKLFGRDDKFGMIGYNDTLQAMLVAGGGALAVKDANDVPQMSFQTERNLAVLNKAMDLIYDQTHYFNFQKLSEHNGVSSDQQYYNCFSENRALFIWARMRLVEEFRGMDANFGILPMPKYDENQEHYSSLVNPYTGVMLAVPKTCSNPERTSILLEALSAESRYTLQPAYYDVVLQRKFARDEESKEMLNIIFSNRTYDIGGVYAFGDVFNQMNLNLILKDSRDVTSFYDKYAAKMDAAIQKVIDVFSEMD